MAKKSKKKNKLSVSFKDVRTFKLIPEGDYLTEVVSISQEEGNEHDYLQWNLSVVEPAKHKGAMLTYNTSLAPQALWNLRNVLEALGVDVPDDEMELELDDYIGMKLGVTNEHRVYEQKKRNDVVDIFSEENFNKSDEEEDEKPKKKKDKKAPVEDDDEDEKPKSRKGKKKPEPEEDEDDDEEDESEAEDEDDEEGEEGDDEEKQKYSASDVQSKDSDELDEVIEEAQLDEDLKDISKIKKKRKAVLAALEEEGLLEEEDDEDEDDD